MQSRLLFAALFAATLAVVVQPGFSQEAPAPAPAGQTARPHRPLPKPTNLKVLPKDIAPEELVKTMRGFAGALGVECSFCHVRVAGKREMNFASDEKEDKGIARVMIQMTQEINATYMTQVHDPDAMPEDKHVTCGTCHRGHQMPEHFVPPTEERHGPPPSGSAPAQ
ncbi:MAG TPA: c-type cytochrome [Acidobacteriaceae bacterium]|jgi:hypothetical protein|nr:c-type cytochrome [Acidobacteriaceae bacterium]